MLRKFRFGSFDSVDLFSYLQTTSPRVVKQEKRLANQHTKRLLLKGSVAQWLARQTRDPAVAGSIPTTAHVVIALGKQFSQYTCLQNRYPAIGS